MALLNTPLERVAKRSKKILDVFTSTVDELSAINQEIDQEVVQQETKKKEIEETISSLSEVRTENNKVINKINQIFQ